MKYYVYGHLRKDTNDIFYIGKGCGKRAWVKSKRNKYWKNIVNKTDFDVVIIEKGLTEIEAFALEIEKINELKPVANLTSGGEGISGYKYKGEKLNKHREQVKFHMNRQDVRNKLSKIKKSYFKNNPEAREKAKTAKLKSLRDNPEQCAKISKKLKKIYKNKEKRHNMSKIKGGGEFIVIDKTNNQQIWKGFSQQLCAEELNIYQSNINKCLKGERKSSGGYIFRYL